MHLVSVSLRLELLLLTINVIYLIPLLLHQYLYPLELVLSICRLRLQVGNGALIVDPRLFQLSDLLLTGAFQRVYICCHGFDFLLHARDVALIGLDFTLELIILRTLSLDPILEFVQILFQQGLILLSLLDEGFKIATNFLILGPQLVDHFQRAFPVLVTLGHVSFQSPDVVLQV